MAKSIEDRIEAAIEKDFTDRRGLRQEWNEIDEDIQQEIRNTWKALIHKELAKEKKEVLIEVGGDHGDGNVELVKKPIGVKVIIKDFDNASLPEDVDVLDINDENVELVPQIREYEAKEEIQ